MSYESIEEAAFKKLMAEIRALRRDVAELKEGVAAEREGLFEQPSRWNNKVYNNRQVCQLLNLSKGTLEKYRNEGLITYTKRGRKYFYSQTDLDRFLKLDTTRTPSQMEGLEGSAD